MAIILESVMFGIPGNPTNPIAPVSVERGTLPTGKISWRRDGKESVPIIILRDLLPLEGIVITPVFRCTGGERSMTFSLEWQCSGLCPEQNPQFGRLENVTLRFSKDTDLTAESPMTLRGTDETSFSIGRFDAALKWTGADESENRFADESRHRVYTILGPPIAPWSAAPDEEERWLWPEVLEAACEWACGARTLDEAVQRITENVFKRGVLLRTKGGLRYNSNNVFTKSDYFHLNEFLDHLSGETPSEFVDCRDLASIVSTFANALGCRLYQSQCGMGSLAAGVKIIGTPKDPPSRFGFHELVWDGGNSMENRVWDACVELNGSPIIASRYGEYVKNVYEPPGAKPVGPAYTSNRPVRLRKVLRTLTGKTEELAQRAHPELKHIFPEPPETTDEGASLFQQVAGVVTKAAGAIATALVPAIVSAIDAMIAGNFPLETANKALNGELNSWTGRMESEGAGAVQVRVSLFDTPQNARRYILDETLGISVPMQTWNLKLKSGTVIGSEDKRTILFQSGALVVSAQLRSGVMDTLATIGGIIGSLPV